MKKTLNDIFYITTFRMCLTEAKYNSHVFTLMCIFK